MRREVGTAADGRLSLFQPKRVLLARAIVMSKNIALSPTPLEARIADRGILPRGVKKSAASNVPLPISSFEESPRHATSG